MTRFRVFDCERLIIAAESTNLEHIQEIFIRAFVAWMETPAPRPPLSLSLQCLDETKLRELARVAGNLPHWTSVAGDFTKPGTQRRPVSALPVEEYEYTCKEEETDAGGQPPAPPAETRPAGR